MRRSSLSAQLLSRLHLHDLQRIDSLYGTCFVDVEPLLPSGTIIVLLTVELASFVSLPLSLYVSAIGLSIMQMSACLFLSMVVPHKSLVDSYKSYIVLVVFSV